MNVEFIGFDKDHPMGDLATHQPACPGGRLALSLLLAGASLLRRRFAPCTHPGMSAGASNSGF